jgi:2-dehydropantoate 2-reductase
VKILVLGAGAIGGYCGGRLAQAGADITFLVRLQRRAQLERDGLRIVSPTGDATLSVNTVDASEVRAVYDVVLLTCKAYDLDSATDAIAPAMNGRVAIVPLLNGMSHLSRLDKRFGTSSVMGGTCALSVTLGTDGVIRHTDALQAVALGERGRGKSDRGLAIAKAFGATKIPCDLVDDIEQNMWEKIAVLSVLAAATCLFRANIGEIIAAPGGLDALETAFAVNGEAAARCGHPLRPAAMEFGRTVLIDARSARSASMRHDLEAGRRVESDHIIGWMVDVARSHGLEPTLLALALTHLKAYEGRRSPG